jgi:hypothetical protein
MSESDDGRWHVDRRVPIATLGALLIQTAAVVWWASSLSERVNNLERQAVLTAPQADRLTRVEVKLETALEGITEIKRLVRKESP